MVEIYSKKDLAVFNLLEQPVWVFDIEKKAMWWANRAAVSLWDADSLQDLLARDFSSDMSEKSASRLREYLVKFSKGETIHDQWKFYPNGGQCTKTVVTTASGIHIEHGRMAMLMEGVYKELWDAAAEATLRGVGETTEQNTKTTALLFDVFPRHVANALRDGRKVEPESRDEVTIFFSDIVGFTEIAAALPDLKVANLLDRLWNRVDEISRFHDVYKVETIGDAYMAVTNLIKNQHDHTKRIADFALEVIQAANETLIDLDDPSRGYINMRVGIHAGPVVANVVGSRNPRYCLFGDTVNIAARMESSSDRNKVHCSDRVSALLMEQDPAIQLRPRGRIKIKGKGEMTTFWVEAQQTIKASEAVEVRTRQPLPQMKFSTRVQ